MIEKLVRKPVRKMNKINWGIYPNRKSIRLLWGENLIQPSPEVIKTIKNEAKYVNLYPDLTQSEIRKKLAEYCNISPDNIILGNGIDGLIELVSKVFIDTNDEVTIPIPTFPVYENATKLMGGIPVYVKLNNDFTLDLNQLLSKITKKTKIIWVANPNNPTGNFLLSNKDIEKILNSISSILVIDECYFEFSNQTCIELTKKYKNLIILRSFSKTFSLAGLRIGYAVSTKKTIDYMKNVQLNIQPFTLTNISLAAASSALKNSNYQKEKTREFNKNKKLFFNKLSEIRNIKVMDTETSFLLLDISRTNLNSIFFKEKMSKKNIFVKDCSIYKNFEKKYIAIGIPPKNKISYVIKIIKEVIKND